mmetsp:Transcript_15630/g.54295  ORF Transcript_15630/g.54295 Transcript_15630/m.54295 type:complete len:474 (-) Transcript_15630:946-2367(-)
MAARKRAGGYLANPSVGEVERSDSDDEAPSGDFERASEEELKARNIVRARRRPAGSSSGGAGDGGGRGLFKSVNLLGGAPSAPRPAGQVKAAPPASLAASSRPRVQGAPRPAWPARPPGSRPALAGTGVGGLPQVASAANPFASAERTGGGLAQPLRQNPFVPTRSLVASDGASAAPTAAAGAPEAMPSTSRTIVPGPSSSTAAGGGTTAHVPSTGGAPGAATPALAHLGGSRTTSVVTGRREYYAQMRELNASFASWVEKQSRETPVSSWVDGVRDYVKHAEALKAEHGDNGVVPAPTSTAGSNHTSTTNGDGPPMGRRRVGGGEAANGAASTAAAPAASTESHSEAPAGAAEDVPRLSGTDEDVVFEARSKLHRLKVEGGDAVWVDLGKGVVRVLLDPASKRARVTFSNSGGRALLNGWLFAKTSASRQGKNSVAVTCIHDGAPGKFLLKVPTADDADRLKAAVLGCKPQT